MLNTFFLTDIGNVLALGNLSLYTEGLPEIGDSEHPVGALNDIVKGTAVVQIGLLETFCLSAIKKKKKPDLSLIS